MDPAQVAENNHGEEQNQLAVAPFAAASLSLSLSNVLPSPTQFFQQRKNAALLAAQATKMRVPTQVYSLANLSLSSATVSPAKISFKSTISANPLQNPFTLGPHRPLDPSNAAGIRRASIVWFRNDLRVHDNECLNSANNESMSVLPVYCFDPREYGKSSSGFNKTGTFQASFALETVADLRKNLQARGSDLVVRVGRPEEVLVEMAKAIGADAIYAHREVSKDEAKAEQRMEAAMKDEGVEVKYFWGSTLFHADDLPFKVQDMPTNYSSFKGKVQGLEVRKTIAALDQLKGVPKRGDVELGEMPSLADLGVSASMPQDGKAASMFGGETEALERIKKFASECQKQPNNGNNDNIYGANFSTKIAPWLTNGSISPRAVFDELKKTASNAISAAKKSDDGGSSWLMNELMWRDFFRFVTKKYSTPAPTTVGAPAMA